MNSNLGLKNVKEKNAQNNEEVKIYTHKNIINNNISNEKLKYISTTINNSYNNKYLFDNLMENNKNSFQNNISQGNQYYNNDYIFQISNESSKNINPMSNNSKSIVISGVSYPISNSDNNMYTSGNLKDNSNMYRNAYGNFVDERQISLNKINTGNYSKTMNYDISNNNMIASKSTNAGSESEDLNMKKPKYVKEIGDDYFYYSTHVIGKGSFGKVVYGRNKKDEDLCFKVEKISNQKNGSILRDEYNIYNYLKDSVGIPQIFKFGEYKKNRYLAMELIGPSLDKFFILCNKKFSLETTIYLGLEMIERIEFVHSRGIIHRDIKPNNFLFGKYSRKIENWDNTLYIIDFGLSTSYLEIQPHYTNSHSNNLYKEGISSNNVNNPSINNVITKYSKCKLPEIIMTTSQQNQMNNPTSINNKLALLEKSGNVDYNHINFKEGCRFVGTPRYASLNTHIGVRQSRRDDLESIAYILIYFYIGDLPWQGVRAKTKSEKKEKIKQIKNELDIFNEPMFLEKHLPLELKELLNMCRNTKFDEIPNYKAMKDILISLREKMKYPAKPVYFDWEDFFLSNNNKEEVKREYKKLYQGYPTINISEYISYLKNKKTINKEESTNIEIEDEIIYLNKDITSSLNTKSSNNNNNSLLTSNNSNSNKIIYESFNNNIKNISQEMFSVKKQNSNYSLLTSISGKTLNIPENDQFDNFNIEKISNDFNNPNYLLNKKKNEYASNRITAANDAKYEEIDKIYIGLHEDSKFHSTGMRINSNLIQERNLNSINQSIELNKERKYKKVVKTTSNNVNTENFLKFSINKDTGEITDDDDKKNRNMIVYESNEDKMNQYENSSSKIRKNKS